MGGSFFFSEEFEWGMTHKGYFKLHTFKITWYLNKKE